jgi:Calpain family cysteine protease
LAERPAFIRRLFESDQLNQQGLYPVWLNISGQWKEFVVDDSFPVQKDDPQQFAFGNTRGDACWVNMLEKAYAKAFGSYGIIDGGMEIEALHDLTGAPYEAYDMSDTERYSLDYIWKRVADADKKGYIMVCGTECSDEREEERDDGLYSGHAYSLINTARVKASDGKMHNIVQVRNPWGQGEWNGDWCDTSKLWTPELRKQLHADKGDDGIFWMSWEDFTTGFQTVGICKIQPNFYWNYIQLNPKIQEDACYQGVLIDIKTAGKYYFSVEQEDSRIYSLNEDSYEYAYVRLTISKVDSNQLKFVNCNLDQQRSVSVNCNMNPGRYVAIFELSSSINTQRKITFTSYGVDLSAMISLQLTKTESQMIEYYSFKDYAMSNKGVWKKEKKPQRIKEGKMFAVAQVEVADRYKDFGLQITKFTLTESNCAVDIVLTAEDQSAGEEDMQSKKSKKRNKRKNAKAGGDKYVPVHMGASKCEIEIDKWGCGVSTRLEVQLTGPGNYGSLQQGNMASHLSFLPKIYNTQISFPTCNCPPGSNPYLMRSGFGGSTLPAGPLHPGNPGTYGGAIPNQLPTIYPPNIGAAGPINPVIGAPGAHQNYSQGQYSTPGFNQAGIPLAGFNQNIPVAGLSNYPQTVPTIGSYPPADYSGAYQQSPNLGGYNPGQPSNQSYSAAQTPGAAQPWYGAPAPIQPYQSAQQPYPGPSAPYNPSQPGQPSYNSNYPPHSGY